MFCKGGAYDSNSKTRLIFMTVVIAVTYTRDLG